MFGFGPFAEDLHIPLASFIILEVSNCVFVCLLIRSRYYEYDADTRTGEKISWFRTISWFFSHAILPND